MLWVCSRAILSRVNRRGILGQCCIATGLRSQAIHRNYIGTVSGWARIAAESGYADQAHLAREFSALAGETPTAWARRLALTDSRLVRPLDALDA